ncbi:hypothetical protein BJH90_09225 [Bacillus halotolerans]|uniref:Uncharacterized protein n=1 Tax=Bacillus halotolerans TaxID=260554 RepID=A0A9Q4HTU8_9BACI|nr:MULTISPECIES: hypothetical protein [Bacillus]MBV7321722.1 hypothetical protein [Halalkalibacterium halodurans]AZV51305.1 hypothetical protein DIC78_21095 [Bacillus halotolerans]MBU5245445.1 hypothetical protein [Bacillus halotolerans]MCM3353389.1 hypothetical protein [Bacillus halotolerans]MCV0023595.1 hypothetical protein [Bacillus sp. XT-2]
MTNQLEEKVELLEQEIEELKWQILKLSNAKLNDPRYPYSNWLIQHNIYSEKRRELEYILSVLNDRVLNSPQPPEQYRKEVEGISSQELHNEKVPDFAEVRDILSKVLGIKEKKVIALLNALKDEGKFKDLSEKLLDEVY